MTCRPSALPPRNANGWGYRCFGPVGAGSSGSARVVSRRVMSSSSPLPWSFLVKETVGS